MLAFVFASFLLCITPGPGVLSLAGVGAAYGYQPGIRYMFGLWIGHNLVAIAVISGLAAVMLAEPRLRFILGVASAAYLLWLAYKIAFAGAKIAFISRPSPPGIQSGVLLQVINPKAYVVNTSIFANFAFIPQNPGLEIATKLLIFNILWTAIHLIWLWSGGAVQRLDLSARTQRTINFAMAGAMLAVVILAAIQL